MAHNALPVRLAIDIKSLSLHHSGIAAFTWGLLRLLMAPDADGPDALAEVPRPELVLIGPPDAFDRLDAAWPATRLPLPLRAALGPLRIPFYDQVSLARALARARADVLYTPNCDAPLIAPCPRMVTIHDLAYRRFPHAYPRATRLYYNRLTRWHARYAERVLTDSAFSAREIGTLVPGAAARLSIVPCPIGPAFLQEPSPARVAAFRAARGLPERFVLYTGGPDARKQVGLVIEAMRRLNRTAAAPLPLVATRAGQGDAAWSRWLGPAWREARAMFLEAVRPEEMPLLYAAASAVAYPSCYEGFGLPVLESLAVGTPVVATRTGFLADEAPPGVGLLAESTSDALAARLEAAIAGELGDAAAMRAYARQAQARVLPAFLRALSGLAGPAPRHA